MLNNKQFDVIKLFFFEWSKFKKFSHHKFEQKKSRKEKRNKIFSNLNTKQVVGILATNLNNLKS